MPARLTRRAVGHSALGAVLAASARRAWAAPSDKKTLRFIAQSDLRVLDPVWTTAYITRNHGYMVFDTLFALDAQYRPQPQMVGDWAVSDDKLTWRFTLRDGLKFHDGQPVRGIDCTTSLRRWMARDSLGQTLATAIADMKGGDDKSFSIALKRPFPLMLDALAKVSSLVPHIMPERLAKTDPFTQVTEMVGSGPFKFIAAAFQPGNKAVYERFADYVPRKEPPSWASGGKVVKVDRVEWLYVPDATTAAAALGNGEVDWWEQPPLDFMPILTASPEISAVNSSPLMNLGGVRFNQLFPPFDKVEMRQAVLAVADQAEYMTALAGDPKYWKTCPGYFTCGTPMANDAGSAALTGKRDYARGKALVAEAGYKGEKIVLLDAVDLTTSHALAQVTFDMMKRLGLNVDLVASDWGSLITRRSSKAPPDKGGWHVFGTGFVGPDMLDPSLNQPLRTNGGSAWFGWPTDDKMEALRTEWIYAADLDARKRLAAQIQQRAFEIVPYIPAGMYQLKTAYRKNIKGVLEAPAIFLWNVEKT